MRANDEKERPTVIQISDRVLHADVERFGINLGAQTFYDSGQMLRNMTFNNPGFEGETWQSILRCRRVTESTCTDGNRWNQWPKDFLKGADFEVISGPGEGERGMVASSDVAVASEDGHGVVLHLSPLAHPLGRDSFLIVRKSMPGDALAGWWSSTSGGGGFATEFHDLAPGTEGKQALRMMAERAGQSATVTSYFDSMAGHSFARLDEPLHLSFRAKGVAGTRQIAIDLRRQTPTGPELFFTRTIQLAPEWRDYGFDFPAHEPQGTTGTVGLSFTAERSEVLLDDVALEPSQHSSVNPTMFRDEVVRALRRLRPGILRYQDGAHLGSSFANMVAPPFARVRAGWSERTATQGVVPLGLPEFLQLCRAVGADPWITLPAALSPDEMRAAIEYLAAPASTSYGAIRAASGQRTPWTQVFHRIHLELGNEMWNGVTFAGAAIPDPPTYGERAKEVFLAARTSPYFNRRSFDLVLGSFALIPGWTRDELAASGGYDSVAVAPYLFDSLNDGTSLEAIFGPMFAEPERIDSRPDGYMAQQKQVAGKTPLSVYEVNLGTADGTASQDAFDAATSSIGAGIALIDHMLLMLRDLGVREQNVWALSGFENTFTNSATHKQQTAPLFGTVVDMGGATGRVRPQFLAEELANEAILPTMLTTQILGNDPLWNQPKSPNNGIALQGAHELQSFAFAGGRRRSLIVLNLSRVQAHDVVLAGPEAPAGDMHVAVLTAKQITDNNERTKEVSITRHSVPATSAKQTLTLPPFSMTVLEWTATP